MHRKKAYYCKCNTKGCNVNRSAKVMHQLFIDLLKSFQVEKQEQEVIKMQIEEQIAGFFKTGIENTKQLKVRLAETQKKKEAIEERFALGEIDRSIYEKFKGKFEKECFDIEQELNKSGSYSSNLKKVIDFTVRVCLNPLILWNKANLFGKRIFQNLLFPEGIIYNRELDQYRTTRINSFFSLINCVSMGLGENKKGESPYLNEKSPLVDPQGLEP